ncbi:unknown protein [Waddlia chondrophila 2032/99]|uniref:Uncharacterized protein n=1 Tax=Waddlia chondrophila 2032/99 TaxID=765953 RepID=F8LC21_9BACT|nr:unknown protein [Waddlia chondrophila 2032/99]
MICIQEHVGDLRRKLQESDCQRGQNKQYFFHDLRVKSLIASIYSICPRIRTQSGVKIRA